MLARRDPALLRALSVRGCRSLPAKPLFLGVFGYSLKLVTEPRLLRGLGGGKRIVTCSHLSQDMPTQQAVGILMGTVTEFGLDGQHAGNRMKTTYSRGTYFIIRPSCSISKTAEARARYLT